jgi:hypothetical protein
MIRSCQEVHRYGVRKLEGSSSRINGRYAANNIFTFLIVAYVLVLQLYLFRLSGRRADGYLRSRIDCPPDAGILPVPQQCRQEYLGQPISGQAAQQAHSKAVAVV